MAWGVTSYGYVRPRLSEIRAEREASWKATFGANRNTARDAIDGMIIDQVSESLDRTYELGEGVYNAHYLSTNGGVSLELWAAGRGFSKNPATHSTVELVIAGTAGTVIPAGYRVRLDDSGAEWALDAEATIGGGGTVAATFTAVDPGPIAAVAGSDWTIVNPVAGWTGVTNSLDADLGRNVETDPEFKARIRRALRGGGIVAALLRLEGVTQVTLFQNRSDIPDSMWNATHWVEALVIGGDDQEIANTLYAWVPDGIQTFGSETVAENVSGDDEEFSFSRPADVEVYFEIDITPGEGFPDTDTATLQTSIRNALVQWADAGHESGEDVSPVDFLTQIAGMVDGKFSAAVRIDTVDPPVATGILSIGDRFVARFDTSRATVTIL